MGLMHFRNINLKLFVADKSSHIILLSCVLLRFGVTDNGVVVVYCMYGHIWLILMKHLTTLTVLVRLFVLVSYFEIFFYLLLISFLFKTALYFLPLLEMSVMNNFFK